MRQEFYIDVYFFVNYSIDFFLLYALKIIRKRQTPIRWLMIAAFFGGAAACAEVLAGSMIAGRVTGRMTAAGGMAVWRLLWRFLWVALPGLAMVWLAFRPKTVRKLVVDTLLLLFISVCVGGIMEMLYQQTGTDGKALPFFTWVFLAAAGFFLFRYLWFTKTEIDHRTACLYRVRLTAEDRFVAATGLLDTGNLLREPGSGRPVTIVSDKIWKVLWRPGMPAGQVPYSTVGNPWGLMETAEITSMEVFGESGQKEKVEKPLIARAPFFMAKDREYDILLHGETLPGKGTTR